MSSTLKESALAVLAAAAGVISFWVWYGAIPAIAASAFQNYRAFIAPGIMLAVAACLFALAAIFTRSRIIRYAGIAVIFGASLRFLAPDGTTAAALGAAFLLACFASRRIRTEYERSIAFSTSQFLKAGLPAYFTAVSLVMTLFYYQEISVQNPAASIVPSAAVDLSLRFLSGAVTDLGAIPQADSLMTVDQFLSQNLEAQLKKEGTSLRALPQQQLAELIAEQRNELARRYGIQIRGGERLTDVLHRTITTKVNEILGPYARFLPFLSALAFFFALRFLTFFVFFVVVVATALLITALHGLNIIRSETQEIQVERLIL